MVGDSYGQGRVLILGRGYSLRHITKQERGKDTKVEVLYIQGSIQVTKLVSSVGRKPTYLNWGIIKKAFEGWVGVLEER